MHRHHPALAFRRGQVRPVDQSFHDPWIDILAKGFPDARVVAQLQDHPVEGCGQLSDFVARRHIDGLIEVARLDRSRTLEQFPDRSTDAAADKVGENQADNRCEHRHDHRDQYRLGLLRPDLRDGAVAYLNHLTANGFDLFIQFVAKRIDSRQTAPHCRKVPGLKA